MHSHRPASFALAVVGVITATVAAQPVLHIPRMETAAPPAKAAPPEKLEAPRLEDNGKAKDNGKAGAKEEARPRTQGILPQDYPGGTYPAIAVTLPEVLKLAVLANLDIAQANIVVERAQVAVLAARGRFLPDLTSGVQYQKHDGTIQATAGNIQLVNRDSLFVGGGPALTLDLSPALFGLGVVNSGLSATRAGQGRVTLETLGRVADAYFAVLRAKRQLARLDEVLDMLTSEQEVEARGGSMGLLPLIKAFVIAGTAVPSDQARVEADVVRRHGERVQALQDVRTASAELSRLLHLSATYFLLPAEDVRFPVQAPGQAWYVTPIEGLVEQALSARPDLAENQALIRAAVRRYQLAKWQPLMPQLQAGLASGGFGGGPEMLTNPKGKTFLGDSGNIKDFGMRTDLNLAVVWRLENMGVGNMARIRDARLQKEQAEIQLLFLQDQAVAQVVQAMEGVQRGLARYNIYKAGLYDDAGNPVGTVYRSLRLNFVRIKGGQGLPLEVLDSTRRLSDVLQGFADAATDYDRARYRLLVTLGLPPETILQGDDVPKPPTAAPSLAQVPLVRAVRAPAAGCARAPEPAPVAPPAAATRGAAPEAAAAEDVAPVPAPAEEAPVIRIGRSRPTESAD